MLKVVTLCACFLLHSSTVAEGADKVVREAYTKEIGQATWHQYLAWHKSQLERAKRGDCDGITYVIYRQRNGFGDDIGAMTGVLKQAFRMQAVFLADGWLAQYLHPTLGGWDLEKVTAEGGLCSKDKSTHVIVNGHVSVGSKILDMPTKQDPYLLERHMSFIRKELISPRPDIAKEIELMQQYAGLNGKFVVGLQIRTGTADKYGSPKFLGATREESTQNAKIFFDCAAGLLDVLNPELIDIDEEVRFFIATDNPEVVERAKADPRIGDKVSVRAGHVTNKMNVNVLLSIGRYFCGGHRPFSTGQ